MLNTEKLREAIDDKGISITKLAKSIGITRESFYNKMNGNNEFKASEIQKTTKVLGLTRDRRDAIFFSDDSESYSRAINPSGN